MGQRLQKSLLYWRTARHLKPSQVFWRLRYRLSNGRPARYSVPNPLPPMDEGVAERLRDLGKYWAEAAPPDGSRVQSFLRGRFTFINKTVQSVRPHWSGLDVPKLWAYHLHYFDYGREIALAHPLPESGESAILRGWVDDWMARNTRGTAPSWDAFPLSARLINWSLIAALYGWRDFEFVSNMHEQLEYLACHLERDLLGNHLLKNAAAMTVAGTLLDSPRAEEGLALLEEQVRSQFLPDGGHIERSPMYHAFALLDLILACAVLEPRPSWLEDAVERGLAFLQGITHEDGEVGQFNDGAADEGPTGATLYALASYFDPDLVPAPRGSAAFAESGLYRLEPGGVGGLILAKAGNSTVNYQPGHAHSDLLSFEYSLRGERLLVNTGTHGYAESPCRAYCQSSASHNTLRINGEEQLEHWSTFRVGRRIHAEVVAWNPREPSLRAAYTTRKGVRHERLFAWDSGGWCRVQDKISGKGALHVETFLHFHPDCRVEAMEDRPCSGVYRPFRMTTANQILQLLIFGAKEVIHHRGTVPLGPGWYFPRFGEAVAADTLIAHSAGMNEMTISFVIAPCDEHGIPPEIIQNFLTAWHPRNGGA